MNIQNLVKTAVKEAIKRQSAYPLTIEIGTEFTDMAGYKIKVNKVKIKNIHLRNPEILIAYTYDNGQNKGRETNSLETFKRDILAIERD